MTKKNPSQEAGVFCLVGWALSNCAPQANNCAGFGFVGFAVTAKVTATDARLGWDAPTLTAGKKRASQQGSRRPELGAVTSRHWPPATLAATVRQAKPAVPTTGRRIHRIRDVVPAVAARYRRPWQRAQLRPDVAPGAGQDVRRRARPQPNRAASIAQCRAVVVRRTLAGRQHRGTLQRAQVSP